MKKITAIIRSHKLEEVKTTLINSGVIGLTVSDMRQFGRFKKQEILYRGAEYTIDFVNRIKLEIIVDEHQVSSLLDALVNSASTGEIGDGKIFISPINEIVRIRTGETNIEAI
ncbi:transcriptional regulator [Aphanothece hegewaldii CCALA 016]|uniref:Nitrogen regulatory protein P-II n=1 Tax=Aphanothece hegewaldii CCALA 016 TaxID=2107694 RepID=A0A2T1LWC7_9CHRO|nr:P-II family nitrogen regulator [Aphanothece hegewaldii]PSF36199.1 transcriptional regulator [Aphanothece hegewaldii CCALA 016]